MTIHCKAVEKCFSVALFVFHFYPDCKFEKILMLDLAMPDMKGLRTKACIHSDEGLTLETSIFESFTVANLPYRLCG